MHRSPLFTRSLPLLFALLSGLAGCAKSPPEPIAVNPGEPLGRVEAFDQLVAVNEAHAARFGMSVGELRRRDVTCVMLATGVEIRPGLILPYDGAMLSAAKLPEDVIEVRVDTMDMDAGVYASQGCKWMQLAWDEDANSFGVFKDEASARAYLDGLATAWKSLGGTLSREIRDDDTGK